MPKSYRAHTDVLIRSTERLPNATALAENLSEAVGRVPTLRLQRLSNECTRHRLYLKLEACNPGGSIKEKNAAYLIEDAEQRGLLKAGGTIVESSSGNFGIGLAMVGASRGYRVMIVVDAKTAPPMRRILRAYGAELVDVPLSEADANGSMQVARMRRAAELAASIPGAWYPCQHRNPVNPHAHYAYTAQEIMRDFDGHPPDVIVIGVSTAGQLAGVSRYFRQHYPSVKLIGVDVAGSVIFNTPAHPYKMTGLGLSFVPPNYDPAQIDLAYVISDGLAFSLCRALARREGLLLGASTGAIVAAGLAYAAKQVDPKTILMINPDRGDRYLETVFNDEWLSQQGLSLYDDEALSEQINRLEPVPMPVLQGNTR